MDTQEMLQCLLARMDANTKTMQENLAKADAHRAKMEALTEMTVRIDANMGSMQAEIKRAIEEKMKDALQSIRSELDETIQQSGKRHDVH
jgi:ribosome recycling factor